jgi:signal transduction histidine kinase
VGAFFRKSKSLIRKNFGFVSQSVKKTVILFITIIISISFLLFFYFHYQTEQSIKDNILAQQIQNQKDLGRSLAQHIQSDLNLIIAKLQGLASSSYLQREVFQSTDTKSLLQTYYHQINSSSPIDRLFVLNNKEMARMDIVPKGQPSYVGKNFSFREWVRDTKNTLQPQFSDGFMGEDGKYRIALTYPIIIKNSSSGSINYAGLVGAVIPTTELFSFYGNIYNIQLKYLAVLDSKAVHLVHPIASLIGKPFFGNYSQNLNKHNPVLNNLVNTAVSLGKPSSGIYDFVNGQRLTTGYPIILNGKPEYSLFIITPTSTIYSKIDSIISNERLEMLSLIAGIIAAIMILILFVMRMNSILERNIKERTKELQESNNSLLLVNRKLESINEQLQTHDKMQQEFISTAAHELRTPLQPILGLSKIVKDKINDNEQKDLLDIIIKNTKKLKRLTEDILDVTRIEGNKLLLNKETICIWELLHSIIKEFEHTLGNNKNIKFKLHFKNIDSNSVNVVADKNRIYQVISNLINNSIKFILSENGKEGDGNGLISITVEKAKIKSNEGNSSDRVIDEVIISIKDNGKGIDPEIFPRLFTKFASKSFQGTGLGLYISKNIIEAHGGKIWAENSEDGKGATFSFSLPLIINDNMNMHLY